MSDYEQLLEDFEKQAAAMTPEQLKKRREAEIGLFKDFKSNPSKETFAPLYNSFKPIIYKAALPNMRNSNIPQSAHMALAAQNFYRALQTYDPSKGGLTTHITNYVGQQGKRLNYKYQNIGYIPEKRITSYQAFINAQEILKDQLGREASSLELSDELKLPVKEIERLRKEVRKDLIMDDRKSEMFAFAQSDKSMQMFRDIQYNLIPQHQVVLEHVVGLNGKTSVGTKKSGTVNMAELKKVTGLGDNTIRSALKSITREVKKYRGSHNVDPNLSIGDLDVSE